MLLTWKFGAVNYDTRWKKAEVIEINKKMKKFNTQKPREIHRAVRGLEEIHFWKGTEFREFLLYFGIVLLKDHLPEIVYNHFLTLVCAVTICYTDAYNRFHSVAKVWFERYIEKYVEIYGIHSIVSNTHNLNHVVGDVEKFGNLNEISAYPYENQLQFLKSRIKQKRLPLEQITRRIVELYIDYEQLYNYDSSKNEAFPHFKYPYVLDNNQVYKEIAINSGCTFSTNRNADSWFLTSSNTIVMMKYALPTVEGTIIYGSPIINTNDFFRQPISSSRLNIFMSNGIAGPVHPFKLDSIKSKMLCLSHDSNLVLIPLLHTLKNI